MKKVNNLKRFSAAAVIFALVSQIGLIFPNQLINTAQADEEPIEPTQIASCQEFYDAITDVDGLAGSYQLTDDLDCTNTGLLDADPETTLSEDDFRFTGTFTGALDGWDGDSVHSLSVHFNIDNDAPSTDDIGLFSVAANATVKNLEFYGGVDFSVSGGESFTNNIGTLVGTMQGGVIHDITATTTIETSDLDGDMLSVGFVGGLVGSCVTSMTQKCGIYASEIISVISMDNEPAGIGGVTGYSTASRLEGLEVYVDITAPLGHNVGGIVGSSEDSGAGGTRIYWSSVHGIEGAGEIVGYLTVGGLVGEMDDGSIEDSYSVIDVQAMSDEVGGLAASLDKTQVARTYTVAALQSEGDEVGGFVANYDVVEAKITDSFAYPTDVTADGSFGGFIDYNGSGQLTRNGWVVLPFESNAIDLDDTSCGLSGPVGLLDNCGYGVDFETIEALEYTESLPSFYNHWDFVNVWDIDPEELPYLRQYTYFDPSDLPENPIYTVSREGNLIGLLDESFNLVHEFVLSGGALIEGFNGLTEQPETGLWYAVAKIASNRVLVTIDEDFVVSIIGTLSQKLAGLAFTDDGTLFAVSGAGADQPHTLFSVNTGDATLTQLKELNVSISGDEESIGFNADDGFLYRGNGLSEIPEENLFEKINPDPESEYEETPIELSGDMSCWGPTTVVYNGTGFIVPEYDSAIALVSLSGHVTCANNPEYVIKGMVLDDGYVDIVNPYAYQASDVIGQVDGDGDPDFETIEANNGEVGINPRGFDLSSGYGESIIDPEHHRLFVSDYQNCRVLGYDLDDYDDLLDHEADYVLGQEGFDTGDCDFGQDNIYGPGQLEYDGNHDVLYVADYDGYRILIYDVRPEGSSNKTMCGTVTNGIENGMNASCVIGQPDFENNLNNIGQTGLDLPWGVEFDSDHNRLFVADSSNKRVLVYDVSSFSNTKPAEYVLGQSDFDAYLSDRTQNTFADDTYNTAYDPNNELLFVFDDKRILVFDVREEESPDKTICGTITQGIENGMDASCVIGQEDFEADVEDTAAYSFWGNGALAFDSVNNQLFASDFYNNRVLVFNFNESPLASGMSATGVIGQVDFESSDFSEEGGDSAFADQSAWGVMIDQKNNRLYASDGENNRILIFDFVRVTNNPYPVGDKDVPFNMTFETEHSQGEVSMELDGDLPDGLVFDGEELSGTPTENGTFTFTVVATDAFNDIGNFYGAKEFTLTIGGDSSNSSGGRNGYISTTGQTDQSNGHGSNYFNKPELFIDGTTIYISKDGTKCPFRDWNEFLSYGFDMTQIKVATSNDMALVNCPIVRAKLGSLVIDPTDQTVYLVGANDIKQPFTSAQVFLGLGFSFSNLIVVNLSDYPTGNQISTAEAIHPEGSLINEKGTVYLMLANQKNPFPSAESFMSYGFKFKQVVPANSYDGPVPVGNILE